MVSLASVTFLCAAALVVAVVLVTTFLNGSFWFVCSGSFLLGRSLLLGAVRAFFLTAARALFWAVIEAFFLAAAEAFLA